MHTSSVKLLENYLRSPGKLLEFLSQEPVGTLMYTTIHICMYALIETIMVGMKLSRGEYVLLKTRGKLSGESVSFPSAPLAETCCAYAFGLLQLCPTSTFTMIFS